MGTVLLEIGGYAFTLHTLLVLSAALAMELLGVYVFLRERENDESVYFFFFANTVFVWLFAFGVAGAAPEAEIATRWSKLAYVGVPFIPPTLYQFTVHVIDRVERRRPWVALQWLVGGAFAIIIMMTDLVVVGAHRYPWGFYPKFSATSVLFPTLVSIGIGASLLEYARAMRQQKGRQRERTRLLFGALAVGPVGLLDFLPAYGVDVYPFGYLGIVAFTVVASYTIWRYRLVELTPSFAAGEILDAMEDPLIVCDEGGMIRVVNDAVESVLGYDEEALLGEFIGDVVVEPPSVDYDDQFAFLQHAVQGREMFLCAENGSEIAVSLTSERLVDPDEGHLGMVVFARDLRGRREAEARLEASRERFELIARGANDGIWDWDLETDEVFFSKQWTAAIGYAEAEIGDDVDEWLERIHEDDRTRVRSELSAYLEGTKSAFECQYRLEHRDGSYRWMEARGLALRNEAGEPVRMVGTQIDVTERKELERQLQREYLHDTLTGLPNRALFLDRLGNMLELQRDGEDRAFSICVLDIDRFTVINDSLGHETGDNILVRVAERLETMVEAQDTVARLGSDEFGILLTDASTREKAVWVVERMAQQLNYPIWLDDEQIHLSVSIGVAVSSRDYQEAEELLRDADIAMYNAKSEASTDITCFDTDMHEKVIGRAQMESELRRAIESEELYVHYQPIVELETESTAGYEALVRWEHPDYGSISPGRFIPVAEESGLIVSLTRLVLRRVCEQISRWNREDSPILAPVHVNISSLDVTVSDFTSYTADLLEETGVPESFLRVELTERVVVGNPDQTADVFEQLDSLDVPVAIDDFGTGYSSLDYLRRFEADAVKLDRDFVRHIQESPESREIVQTISSLAGKLQMDVIAEGIERSRELETIRSFDISYGQGYHWAKPSSPETLPELEW